MKIVNALFLIICIVSCIVSSANVNAGELEWKTFVSEDGRFSVSMPGEPKFTEKVEATIVGPIQENLYSYRNGPIDLDAEYSDLPFLAALFGKRSRIYNDIVEEFLKRINGTEISIEAVELDAYRGKVLTYETSKRYGKLWMLLISRRIYALNASVPKDYPDRSFMELYFNSFEPVYRFAKSHHK